MVKTLKMRISVKDIQDYYRKEGVEVCILDQTQRPKLKKEYNVVLNKHLETLLSLNRFTDKYGITLTFNKKWYNEDPIDLARIVQIKIDNSRCFKKVKYILCPEFTSHGNLHYHGIIWDCYQMPFQQCVRMWRRQFGYVKPELEIKYYYCGTTITCSIKKQMITPKKRSMCWLHYIIKDRGKVGLPIIYSY